jgi:hypothetical protein
MKRPVRCPFGIIYDSEQYPECPCVNCATLRASASSEAKQPSDTPAPAPAKHAGRPWMRRVLIGTVALLVVAAAGAYGAKAWIEMRVEREIESVFLDMRAAFGKAEHGQTEIDIWGRSIKIADILLQSNSEPSTTIKIGQFHASGIGIPISRIRAGHVEIADWELVAPVSSKLSLAQKAPRINIDDVSIARSALQKIDASSAIEWIRLAIERAASSSASSIAIPTLSAIVTPTGNSANPSSAEYTFSNIQVRAVGEGRVGVASIDRIHVKAGMDARGRANSTTEIADISVADLDLRVLQGMLAQQGANEDSYRPLYREVSVGPYTTTFDGGGSVHMDGAKIGGFSVKPAALAWPELLAVGEGDRSKLAQLCDGIRIAEFELRGGNIQIPRQTDLKFAALRLSGLADGRIGEAILEDLNGASQHDSFNLGRFVLKGLALANLLRKSSQLATAGGPPSLQQVTDFLSLAEGIEVRRFSAPEKKSGKLLQIETLTASWGNFTGPLPSSARLAATIIYPTSLAEPGPFADLARAGFPTATFSIDIGGAWDEKRQTFSVAPAKLEVQHLFSVTASLALSNVARSIFTVDPVQFKSAAEPLELDLIDFSLRDNGGLDFLIAQAAKNQRVSPTMARQSLVENMIKKLEPQLQSNPDLWRLMDAVARFIETPGQMLTIRLTPNGRVNAAQAVQGEFITALARFKLDASVTGAAPADAAAQAWAQAKDTTNAAVVEEFIAHFPESPYARLARVRLDELKRSQLAVAAPPPTSVAPALQHQISIPDGLTSEQIVARLRDNPVLSGDVDEVPAEGSLLPDSYRFSQDLARKEMIQRMREAQAKVLQDAWERRDPDSPLKSPEQLIILASIIEKETGKPEERAHIAAFANRLKQRMKLQSDPTIIYGLVAGKGSLGRPLTTADIAQPTPYNTYLINGLPPGPIANPGRASIEAAAHPARTNELYFVADGLGGHLFAATLEEHRANVARLRERERSSNP